MPRNVASLAALALTGLALALAAPPARAQDVALTNGDLRFVLSGGGNIKLFLHGIPVIRESHLYIVKPGWTGALMNQDQVPGKTATSEENGVKVALASYETDNAWSKYRYELGPDSLKVTLTYGVKNGQAAEVEYCSAYLNGNVLHGAPFSAETVEGPRSGITPMYAKSEDQQQSLLCPLLKTVHFDTRLGPIDINVEGGDDSVRYFRLFDARGGHQEWASNNPVFWFGVGAPAIPVPPGQQTVTVTYRFGTPVSHTAAPNATVQTVSAVSAARVPYMPDFPVIPHPKEAKYADTPVLVNANTHIVIPDAPCAEEKAAARELQAELKGFWGVSVPIWRAKQELASRQGEVHATYRSVIILRRDGERSTEPLFPYPAAPNKAEGYGLLTSGSNAVVNGRDGRGVYFGAQTLKQLLRLAPDGSVVLKGARMRDWPSLSMRGVHWFGGPNSLPFVKKMVDRIVAPLKMNTMLYQADFTKWDSQPDLWGDARMTDKKDVKAAVDYGRAHFIEPIPLVQGMGHSDWLFANGKNRDLACDPEKPYSFNPFLKESYDKQFAIWQETIDLFKPIRYYHIGHDEITTGGGFPPKGNTKDVNQIILDDIKKDHDWLKARGLKTMMWGDEFLHYPEEASDAGNATMENAKIRRDALPKDIVIADWHYASETEKFPSVDIFQKDGHGVVGVTWYQWPNIQNFSRVLTEQKSLGLIQSTWAGFTMSLDIVDGPMFNQFVAYLVAAENAWNGGYPGTKDLGYNPDDAFSYFWHRKPMDRTKYAGFTADLASASNAAMWDWMNGGGSQGSGGRSGSGNAKPGTLSPEGLHSVQGVALRVGKPVWLSGALNPQGAWPKAVTVPVGDRPVSELQFVWGTTEQAAANQPVANLTVTYADGKAQIVPVRYGSEIFAFPDTRGGSQTTIFWQGKTALGTPAVARTWAWKNPRPGVKVASVTVTSLDTEAAPVVLALTGIAPKG